MRIWSGFLGLAVGLLMAAGCLSGCATGSSEPTVEVGVADLRFSGVTVFETTAEVDIRVENLLPDELELTGGSHRLRVNGVNLGRGASGESLRIPRLNSGVQRVSFHLRNLSMARTIQDLSRSGALNYELESTLWLAKTGGRDRMVRVSRSGRLDLRKELGRGAE